MRQQSVAFPVLVLLIDHDQARRQGLADHLARESGLDVLGQGSSVVEALDSVPVGIRPDVVVLNADAPDMAPVRAWAFLRANLPHQIGIVALTNGHNVRVLDNVLAAGVVALHPADAPYETVRRAAMNTARGQLDFDAGLAHAAMDMLMEPLSDAVIQVRGLSIDIEKSRVTRWGREVELSSLEFGVLRELALKAAQTVTVDELLSAVWNTSLITGGTVDQVKSCIKRLQLKLEPDRSRPHYVRSVRGAGYMLRNPLAAEPPG